VTVSCAITSSEAEAELFTRHRRRTCHWQLRHNYKYPSLPLSSHHVRRSAVQRSTFTESNSRPCITALRCGTLKPVENLHKQPGHVSIGDVGYLDNGAFMRMFNVTLPWDDPSNKLLGKPDKYERIKPMYSGNVRDNEIREGEYCTPHVSKVDNVGAVTHEE
jgi:hypothetical protein